MIQSDLIRNVADQACASKKTVEAVLKSLCDVAQIELGTEGGEIPLPGLGKLKATVKAARKGINPATGAEIDIPARNAVKFVAAKGLKDAIA
jgi:DNA-binding protein HU-beta